MDDMPLEFGILSKTIESAQTRVEGYNFDIRKHVLEYDDVVNKQREVIYAQRWEVLNAPDLREQVLRMVQDEVGRVVATHTPGPDPQDWDLRGLYNELRAFYPLPPNFDYRQWEKLSSAQIEGQLSEVAERAYDEINRSIGHQVYRQAVQEDVTLESLAQSGDLGRRLVYQRLVERLGTEPGEDVISQPLRRLADETKTLIEESFVEVYTLLRDRQLVLRAVDSLWVRHLTDLSELREGIGLRAYGQQNPLVAYRKEAHEMYEALLARIQEMVARSVYLVPQTLATQLGGGRRQLQAVRPGVSTEKGARPGSQPVRTSADRQALGRNDPCWCGSGKKYKQCHMRKDMEEQRGSVAAARPPSGPGRKQRRRR